MELWMQALIIGVLILANIIVVYVCHKKRERKIDDLIFYLMKVQDNMELPAFDSMNEGRLGILQSEIYKLFYRYACRHCKPA